MNANDIKELLKNTDYKEVVTGLIMYDLGYTEEEAEIIFYKFMNDKTLGSIFEISEIL